jgi:transposase
MVARDELCRRFCAIPGVGSVTASTFKAAIDDPHRFSKSKTVGAHFGLTSRRIQTGTSIDIEGHISKCGDGEVRTVLYEAASAMLVRSKQWCGIKKLGVSGSQPNAATSARWWPLHPSWQWSCIACGSMDLRSGSRPKMSMPLNRT